MITPFAIRDAHTNRGCQVMPWYTKPNGSSCNWANRHLTPYRKRGRIAIGRGEPMSCWVMPSGLHRFPKTASRPKAW